MLETRALTRRLRANGTRHVYREDPMSRVVTRARDREFEGIRHAAVFKAINQAINFFCASVVCFVAFSVYMAISPDKRCSANNLSENCLWSLTIVLSCALVSAYNRPTFLPQSHYFKLSVFRCTRFVLRGACSFFVLALLFLLPVVSSDQDQFSAFRRREVI